MASNQNVNQPASAAQRLQPSPSTKKASSPSAAAILKAEVDKQAGVINGLQSGMNNLTSQLGQLMQLIQLQNVTHQQVVQQPAGVISGPPVHQHQVTPHQPQPVAAFPQPGPINRTEAGYQSRSSNCAGCGQRKRDGAVVLLTGEYIPSGTTTDWLKLQSEVLITMAQDGFRQPYKVSGAWLASELSKRQNTGRATSVPGFLSGEPQSSHPTVRLANGPLLRRATSDEEVQQYARRVLTEAQNLMQQGFSL